MNDGAFARAEGRIIAVKKTDTRYNALFAFSKLIINYDTLFHFISFVFIVLVLYTLLCEALAESCVFFTFRN